MLWTHTTHTYCKIIPQRDSQRSQISLNSPYALTDVVNLVAFCAVQIAKHSVNLLNAFIQSFVSHTYKRTQDKLPDIPSPQMANQTTSRHTSRIHRTIQSFCSFISCSFCFLLSVSPPFIAHYSRRMIDTMTQKAHSSSNRSKIVFFLSDLKCTLIEINPDEKKIVLTN